MKKQTCGLVLEGGGMRGIFSAGVLDVLMEHGISFDCAVGVSAGAAFGCNYKSGQIGRALRYNLNYCKDPRYCSLRSLLRTGDLFGAQFCYRDIPLELDVFDFDTYDRSPMRFYAVCTDLETGQPVYHLCDKADLECFEWIRASASMPLVSRPVQIGRQHLLDGGISDSIPLGFSIRLGLDRHVVILTQPRSYKKKQNSLLPLFRVALRKYPQTVQAIANRHTVYNESRNFVFEQERNGTAFVICPEEPLPIGRTSHDPDCIQSVYQIGRQAAEECLPALASFMGTHL